MAESGNTLTTDIKQPNYNLTKGCDCMKKKIVIAVVVVAVLVATTVAMYFVNFSNDIPDKELAFVDSSPATVQSGVLL